MKNTCSFCGKEYSYEEESGKYKNYHMDGFKNKYFCFDCFCRLHKRIIKDYLFLWTRNDSAYYKDNKKDECCTCSKCGSEFNRYDRNKKLADKKISGLAQVSDDLCYECSCTENHIDEYFKMIELYSPELIENL